jgi:hypothetical protein
MENKGKKCSTRSSVVLSIGYKRSTNLSLDHDEMMAHNVSVNKRAHIEGNEVVACIKVSIFHNLSVFRDEKYSAEKQNSRFGVGEV